jgi:hypothetical protein
LAFTAGFLSAVFFSDLGAVTTGDSTLYGTGVSAGVEPKIFFKNDNIINLLVEYLPFLSLSFNIIYCTTA